jgi:sulfur-oxidizing protein SoxX
MKQRPIAVALAATAIATSSATLVLSENPQQSVGDFVVTGDAIVQPLTSTAGDAARGRRIVLDRETGNCLICHKVPEAAESFQGDLGPDLGGIAKRLTAAQLRLRLVDESRLNPQTLMPPYHRAEGLSRVAGRYRGRPVLTAQEIEDVVAYLGTLTQ